jgi:hypothetical protein
MEHLHLSIGGGFVSKYIIYKEINKQNKTKQMARENRLTEGVFTGIVGTREKISSYDKFLNVNVDLTRKHSPELTKYCKKYRDIINKNKVKFQNLAKLEEVIMQIRSKETLLENIKLSTVREYIYARSLFYREDKGTKDIRVIVDKTDIYGTDLKSLLENKDFMSKATSKLESAMDKDIQENLNKIQDIF